MNLERSSAAAVCFFLALQLGAQVVPWQEKSELWLVPAHLAPTSAARLHDAEILIVSSTLLTPLLNGNYDLDVTPWLTIGAEDICAGEPFLGQPDVALGAVDGCSGFLAGPDRVVTAGHCVASDGDQSLKQYPCTGLYHVIFDWADHGPIAPGTTTIEVDGDNVFGCQDVVIDTFPGAAIALPLSSLAASSDYAVLTLTAPVTDRLPLIMERIPRTAVGDTALVLSHPNGLPLKGEFATVTGPAVIEAHVLGGSSGSGAIGMGTGKVAFNLAIGNTDWPLSVGNPPCKILDFNSGAESAAGTSASIWNKDVPPLGLQVVPQGGAVNATYYGPPTASQADFPTFLVDIEVPLGGLPANEDLLDWEVRHDYTTFGQPFVVVSGPTSGQLGEGQAETLEFAPNVTVTPGLVEEVMPFFDYLYETREPIVHKAYVGIEGFTVTPDDDLVGEGGLGVPHGETRNYTLRNRWIVPQDVTIWASEEWIRLNGQDGTIPQTFTLPPVGGAGVSLPLVIDGTGMSPGVQPDATVTFSSDDSGTPAFERQQTVRFDHCRQRKDGPTWTATIPPGEEDSISFQVTTDPSMGLIDDVDVVAMATSTGENRPEYRVTIVAPDLQQVLLKDFHEMLLVYYDQDVVTPGVLLNDLEMGPASGLWKLVFRNHEDSTGDLEVDLSRWDVRLHVDGADDCVP